MGQIILASASPRRKELLEQIGLTFEVCPARGEERITKQSPSAVVRELASQKAQEVASMIKSYESAHAGLTTPQDIIVIGADTVVSCRESRGNESREVILGKPSNQEDAFRMLSMLSGKMHSVYTGVSLVLLDASGRVGEHIFYERTDVTMCEMSEQEIRRYIETEEPMDKAGAYGIQGKCAVYIDKIDGDYNNVVGLPVAAIYRECRKLGMDLYLWQNEM